MRHDDPWEFNTPDDDPFYEPPESDKSLATQVQGFIVVGLMTVAVLLVTQFLKLYDRWRHLPPTEAK